MRPEARIVLVYITAVRIPAKGMKDDGGCAQYVCDGS